MPNVNITKAKALAASNSQNIKHFYQNTINLPFTKFQIKNVESKELGKYNESLITESSLNLYNSQFEESKIKQTQLKREDFFILHDGPPFANGDIHLGHALNKVLKDIINRYNLLFKNKYVHYKPGWDTHGLPIEFKITSKINKSKDKSERSILTDTIKLRELCHEYALEQIEIQKNTFKNLAIMTDLNKNYKTLDSSYEIGELENWLKLVENGLVERLEKPTYWSIENRTSLAEAELEYNENHVSSSCHVKFPIVSEGDLKGTKLLIWTTTPWTLLANKAICFNPELSYIIVENKEGEKIIVEETLFKNNQIPNMDGYIQKRKGSVDINNLLYTNPIMKGNKKFPTLPGSHVTNSQGTGLVHTAPSHGLDDFNVGKKHKLELSTPVNFKGQYNIDIDNWAYNLNFKKPVVKVLDKETTTTIIDYLRDNNMLHNTHEYTHSYPYDWRSKKPIIILTTPQFFINLETVKPNTLAAISSDHKNPIAFKPESGRKRLSSFIEKRKEWCISRQRTWGVPIPYFISEAGATYMTPKSIRFVIEQIKETGINKWFEDNDDIWKWVDSESKNEMLAVGKGWRKGKDTLDVWFDSGSSWRVLEKDFAQYKNKDGSSIVADLYLEGSDQHRGWFQSSLLSKIAALNEKAPYKKVLTHGFALDAKGIKMSKSLGNVITPMEVILGNKQKQLPALDIDGLRLLVANSLYTNDISIGKETLNINHDLFKKTRSFLKFLMGNLQNFDHNQILPVNELADLDRFILQKIKQDFAEVDRHFEENDFTKIISIFNSFISNEMNGVFLEASRDELYCGDTHKSLRRKQLLSTSFYILDYCRCILAPIMPITIQEIWNFNYQPYKLPGQKHRLLNGLSPFTREFLLQDVEVLSKDLSKEFSLKKLLNAAFKVLTAENKEITKKLHVFAEIKLSSTDFKNLSTDVVEELFQVSQVSFVIDESVNEMQLRVYPSQQKDCNRCWKRVVPEKSEKDICDRCADVLGHTH
ncbi:hypothetical protein QEN19_002050 [Hanseniaspora menglaensis]